MRMGRSIVRKRPCALAPRAQRNTVLLPRAPRANDEEATRHAGLITDQGTTWATAESDFPTHGCRPSTTDGSARSDPAAPSSANTPRGPFRAPYHELSTPATPNDGTAMVPDLAHPLPRLTKPPGRILPTGELNVQVRLGRPDEAESASESVPGSSDSRREAGPRSRCGVRAAVPAVNVFEADGLRTHGVHPWPPRILPVEVKWSGLNRVEVHNKVGTNHHTERHFRSALSLDQEVSWRRRHRIDTRYIDRCNLRWEAERASSTLVARTPSLFSLALASDEPPEPGNSERDRSCDRAVEETDRKSDYSDEGRCH